MASHEDMAEAGERAVRAMREARTRRVTRRLVLRTTGAGLVAAGAVTAGGMPALAGRTEQPGHDDAGASPAGPDSADDPAEADTAPVIAHLRNARTGEIDLFRGSSQVRVHDTALAAHLIRASR